eukprot:m51a1_g394 hypothetical protein (104) ;mRNA; r:703285-703651
MQTSAGNVVEEREPPASVDDPAPHSSSTDSPDSPLSPTAARDLELQMQLRKIDEDIDGQIAEMEKSRQELEKSRAKRKADLQEAYHKLYAARSGPGDSKSSIA